MEIDITEVLIALFSGGGIIGVWMNSRVEMRKSQSMLEERSHKALEERSRQLFEQFRDSNAADREEFARQRSEWAAERERILEKLNACEQARDEEAEERAILKAEVAYMRGKIDLLTRSEEGGSSSKQTAPPTFRN